MGLRLAGGFIISALLAGCAGQSTPLGGGQTAAPGLDSLDSHDMSGRWKLTAPNAPSCGMHFSGTPEEKAGTIEPEGGCPAKFFTSRHWILSGNQLTISDHKQAPLARLKLSHGQFSGKSTAGIPVTLSRYPTPAS
jgi:Protease inhibitor Inh